MQRQDYERAASDYFTKDTQGKLEFQKFYSPSLLQQVVDEMQRTTLPTITGARITVARLVREGKLVRTDGRTETDDRLEAVTAARANLDQVVAEVDAAPLTPSELEYFGSLSQRELSRLYYGDDGDAVCEFAIRYRKACKTFGFVVPPKFGNQEVIDDGGEFELTAEQYNRMPAAEMKLWLRDPQRKMAIYKLLKSGQV